MPMQYARQYAEQIRVRIRKSFEDKAEDNSSIGTKQASVEEGGQSQARTRSTR